MEEAVVTVLPSVETPPDSKTDDLSSLKPALTPPTSEDMDKRERMSSELTDLEDDDDDEEIEPDHYFEGGKIPVFKPTMDQFRNFKKFIDKIDKYGMKSGIVKVIPPTEWRDSLPSLDDAIKTIKVKNPITQEFAGQHGIYTQANIEKQRSYNLVEWRALTDEHHHQPPAKRGERRRGAQEPVTRTRSTRSGAAAQPKPQDDTSTPKRGPGRPRRRPVKEETKDEPRAKEEEKEGDEMEPIDVPPTPKSPGKEEERKPSKRVKLEHNLKEAESSSKPRGRQPRSITSRRKNNRTETADWVDEAVFEGFDYRFPAAKEFTVERCKELEDVYWKTINYGQPMYGADMPGSLFDDRTPCWNVAKLPNLLDVLGTKVPGVNTAYLYLGMWKATFAWHLEDVDLYSINYIHFGAPKQWYSISQEDARRFEAAMKSIWPQDAKNCSQFLRHKTYLISPAQLEKQFNIKVNRLVHYEGEFVITYPYGYHSGYNLGYNCAESVNFANESWLSYGRIAKKCECEADSVWVDVNEIERKLRGEPTPEYYEETDDEDDMDETAHDFPSPPPSVAGKQKSKARKRKRDTGKTDSKDAKDAKAKKKVKRILKVPGKAMPCILCPNDVTYDELLPTDTGEKAHRLCADYTPETWISSQTVCNVGNIDKARLELKCNYCRSKRGSVFQCSAKKCARAFHATCAAAAGVQVDIGPVPTFDEEGTEYFYDGYDFRCRFHRPKKRHMKTVDGDTLERDKLVFNHAKDLKQGMVVQYQFLGSDMVYGGIVVENRPAEWTVVVDILPDGDRVEIEWKYLLVLDPAESQRPKPSPNAKPLPDHLKDNDPSLAITNRTDGVPQMGDAFEDPKSIHKWAEFHTAAEVVQKLVKIDLSRENRLWFYLGKTSTDARAQYTHDIAKPVHNTKSNFLDSVKEHPKPVPPVLRQSFPASYPRPVSIIQPRAQAQILPPLHAHQSQQPHPPHIRPADKAFYAKVKTEAAVAPRYPFHNYNYPSEPWKNPHSPVAHQPNVIYDYRASAPQYGHSSAAQSYRPGQYQNHFGPSYTSNSKPISTVATAAGTDPRVRPVQQTQFSYYQPPVPPGPRPLAPQHQVYTSSAGARALPPARQLQQSQSHSASTSGAPMMGVLKETKVLSKPMYAQPAPSSSSVSTPTSTGRTSYLVPDGGFTPEWMPRPSGVNGPQRQPSSHAPAPAGLGQGFQQQGGASSLPPPRPGPRFQSVDAFRQDIAKTQMPGMPKFQRMMNQLQNLPRATGGPATSSPSRASTQFQAASNTPTTAPNLLTRTSPAGAPKASPGVSVSNPEQAKSIENTEPHRPTPSPLTDFSGTPKGPEYSPLSDTDGGHGAKEHGATPPVPEEGSTTPKGPPPMPLPHSTSGETWRYT